MKPTPQWKGEEGMIMVPVKSLVRDHTIYPREGIDQDHVQRMINAAAAGVMFPPIIAEAKTRRIVDGYHRFAMAERTVGLDGEVGVVFKRYANDEDLFLDALRYNSSHGLTLSAADRIHSLKIAQRLTISMDKTAAVLHMTVDAAAKLSVVPIRTPGSQEPLSVKINPRFSPRVHTEPVESAPKNEVSRPPEFPIIGSLDRVIRWLESAPSPESPEIVRRLDRLRELLDAAYVGAN